eukprot:gene9989-20776_t
MGFSPYKMSRILTTAIQRPQLQYCARISRHYLAFQEFQNDSTASNPPSSINPYANNNFRPTETTTVKIPTDSFYLDQLNDSIPSTESQFPRLVEGTNNRYFQQVSDLTPNDMLQRFSQNAPRHVQEAVKSTIMSILGNLPSYALDASLITTNSKLANLMFQMQITGYMFKNAEYRMSLTRSLK